jgi:hypothetical protein
MTFSMEQLQAAHKHSSCHRTEIGASDVCGCFYCKGTYAPVAIEQWLDEGDGTALCPECAIDSVLGSASGFPVSDPNFLTAMHEHWFERTVHVED